MKRISNSFTADELNVLNLIMKSVMIGKIPDMVFRRPEWASACKKIQGMHEKAQALLAEVKAEKMAMLPPPGPEAEPVKLVDLTADTSTL